MAYSRIMTKEELHSYLRADDVPKTSAVKDMITQSRRDAVSTSIALRGRMSFLSSDELKDLLTDKEVYIRVTEKTE